MEKEAKNNKAPNNNAEKKTANASAPVTLSKPEYDALKAKADERDAFADKYLRAFAEFENAKKRLEKEKIECFKYANEGFILQLLPILDNLEIAEKHLKEAKDFKAVREGVDMIQAQMQDFLKDIGIERVKAVGEKFDPNLHDPIETEEAKDKNDGLVTAELKPGYKFSGRLLRPAMVRIAKKKE